MEYRSFPIKYGRKKATLTIHYDECAQNPRKGFDDGNVCTLVMQRSYQRWSEYDSLPDNYDHMGKFMESIEYCRNVAAAFEVHVYGECTPKVGMW